MIPHTPPRIHPSFEDVIRFKSDTIISLRLKCGLACLNVERHWLLYHCRHQNLPVVSGHVFVSRDTSLDEFIFKFTLSSNFDPVQQKGIVLRVSSLPVHVVAPT